MKRLFAPIGRAAGYVVVFYVIFSVLYFGIVLTAGLGWNDPLALMLAIPIASVATASLIADRFLDDEPKCASTPSSE